MLKLIFYVFCLFLCLAKEDVYKKKTKLYNWKHNMNEVTKPIITQKHLSTEIVTRFSKEVHEQSYAPLEKKFTDSKFQRMKSLKNIEKRLSI